MKTTDTEKNSPDCLLQFRELTYEAIPLVLSLLRQSGSRSCDYTVGGIYLWIDCFNYRYAVCRDTLFLKGEVGDGMRRTAFSLPMGAMPVEKAVELLREYCRCSGDRLEFSAIPDERIDEFRALCPKEISVLEHGADYVYDASLMASFAGKRMSKKRNHANKFKMLYPDAVCEPIAAGNIGAVKACFREICAVPPDGEMARYERGLVWHVLDNLERYDFETLCLKVGGEVAAFTLGEVMNDTLHDHVEKALRRFEGSGETVFRQFVASVAARYPQVRYVNREDDAGDAGLRKSKMSYHPEFLLRKYNVIFD